MKGSRDKTLQWGCTAWGHKLYDDERVQCLRLGAAPLLGLGNGSLPESVFELAGNGLQILHAAGSVGSPPLGLGAPVEPSHLSSGVAAGSACGVLDVE